MVAVLDPCLNVEVVEKNGGQLFAKLVCSMCAHCTVWFEATITLHLAQQVRIVS